ncbi:MAG: DnaA/Hda family protein [Gemmataceae bacterium]
MAHASAQAVAAQPAREANPLVLHGPVGTGKTHLLEGVHTALREQHPQLRVLFLSAEEFTNRFLASMHQGKLSSFRRQFRDCDALLLDDLHFLAKKAATQEEFLHTFDALLAEGAQVVVTTDCHPRLADRLMPELLDRLHGGAVFGLQAPDADTRRLLIETKACQPGRQPLPAPVIQLLAERLRGNVRELEGALFSLFHISRVTGRPIDAALAHEMLGEVLRHNVRLVQLDDVDRAVCHVLGLEKGALQSKQRGWKISHPRMLAMYLARKHTGATYTDIGERFGGRNHSTAVAGEKKVRQWLEEDGEIHLGQRRLRVRDAVQRAEHALRQH